MDILWDIFVMLWIYRELYIEEILPSFEHKFLSNNINPDHHEFDMKYIFIVCILELTVPNRRNSVCVCVCVCVCVKSFAWLESTYPRLLSYLNLCTFDIKQHNPS
jgi:hypothetical protein